MRVCFSGCIEPFFALKDISVMRLEVFPLRGEGSVYRLENGGSFRCAFNPQPSAPGREFCHGFPTTLLAVFSILFSAAQKGKSEGGRQRG